MRRQPFRCVGGCVGMVWHWTPCKMRLTRYPMQRGVFLRVDLFYPLHHYIHVGIFLGRGGLNDVNEDVRGKQRRVPKRIIPDKQLCIIP